MDTLEVNKEYLQAVDPSIAWHYQIIPIEIHNGIEEYAINKEADLEAAKQELQLISGNEVRLTPYPSEVIEKALNKYYFKSKKESISVLAEENFVMKLIEDAKELSCSDIHIERYEDNRRVRFRLDGQLVTRYTIPAEDYPSIINKIKILAKLDIAEKRLPQDGRVLYHTDQYRFDIRVSSLPTLHGEKIVLRLLGSDASDLDINKLGFNTTNLNSYLESVKKPHGIVLISGPTGSGKTTTLYATLGLLNQEHKNIITIEDPIEYTLDGINQVQLRENIGLDFSKALRTFLRQDPDIIMVGEIRDPDTANMAIRAALTGHLVLSTIHTNSAWGIVSRLIDMGIPPYLLATTLNATIAQRLLRKLCTHCKEKRKFNQPIKNPNLNPPIYEYLPKGCSHCFHTGYSGRIAIYEVIAIDDELSLRIKNRDLEINNLLKSKGIGTLANNAYYLFESGETSYEEVYPILN
ncbi:general secretion pathway protein E/type IV pilus assembly protein PilB [Ekhidna lutea]|uniref:General secretion pathway protein E/type IV pilus assembly protein PilB n=1 Tax=Ekhidna lutea TaxID=447679 RepID=A0A239K7G0_EKHLU|nr:GspE/PulE family protein [Ekhidna lutea]SNT14045.1 general secretion pathway protein E/type IV pilus assembly protein PilB [Ekhidna lutea]